MDVLTPLSKQHQSLAELAYQVIRDKIVSGEIQPGEWLRQEQLAQQLDVSQTPVRQALDNLVADGLAERVMHKGVRVPEILEREIAEVYCLRLLLDPLVARLAAINVSTDQLEALQLIINQSEKLTSLIDMPARRNLNREFHMVISEASGNRTLKRCYELMWNKFPDWMFYEGLHKDQDTLISRLSQEVEEHKTIVDAIASHNPDLVEKISSHHIKAFMKDDLIEIFNVPRETLDEGERQMGL